MLPDWAPNLHPLIIHFPIALLFSAALIDSVGMVLKNQEVWRRAAMGLYVGGMVAVIVAYFTGEAAADSVFLPTEANALLTEHSDLGHYVLYFFCVYGIVRGLLYYMKLDAKGIIRTASYVVGLGGAVLVWVTADHGGQLVYEYGVGVKAVPQEEVQLPAMTSADSAPVRNENGGWTFKPTRASAWMSSMSTYGATGSLEMSMRDGAERGDVLGITSDGQPAMFTFDYDMVTVQIDAALNLDDFEGTVMFVHHVVDENNYHFTSVSNTSMRQGRSENGDIFLMADEDYSPSGWHSYRAVADQTHFRAYSDQQLVAHGHGDDPGVGPVGIRLNGTGTVLLDFVQTVSLRGEGVGEVAVDAAASEEAAEDHSEMEDGDGEGAGETEEEEHDH